MIKDDAELMRYISEDLKKSKEFCSYVKAGILERSCIKRRPPNMLHVNPKNKFSLSKPGPHFGIINEYCARLASSSKEHDEIDPLIVEKMPSGEYMIRDGHHRWAAAMKMGSSSVPVKIVNLTYEEDYLKMLEKTSNTKGIFFDFDKVLCATEDHPDAEENPHMIPGIFHKMYTEGLRPGVIKLFHELQQQGYDIWIYTKKYHSAEHLRSFFKAYGVKVDGIINGYGQRNSTNEEREAFELVSKKYNLLYNIESEEMIRFCPTEKDIEIYDLDEKGCDWARNVRKHVLVN